MACVVGFGLSIWGENVKAQREANDKRLGHAVSRALGLLAAADRVQAEGSILAYAAYLRETGQRPGADQVQAMMDRFNSAMATVDRLILEADVLGPDGLGDVGRTLQAQARVFSAAINGMNLRVTAENAKKVQNEIIPAFHAAFEQATAQTRVLLDAYASSGHRSHCRALSSQNQVLPA